MVDNVTFDTQDTDVYANKKGFSGVITRYIVDARLEYPCVFLGGEEPKKGVLELLKGMIVRSVTTDKADNYFHIYFVVEESVMKLGRVSRESLRYILALPEFDIFEKVAYVTETEKIEGNYLFALLPF
jgi:hypothetical protein